MPNPPENADYAIYIDFEKGSKNPERIFSALDKAIKGFKKLDGVLCKSVDSNIEPILLLEEIEAGSIKVWLKNALEAVDDQAIKELDWKPAIGKYLVKAKYAYIKWANKPNKDLQSIKDLTSETRKLAEESEIKRLPFYGELTSKDIIEVSDVFDDAKQSLMDEDSVKFLTKDDSIKFDLTVNTSPANIEEILTKEIIKNEKINLVLVVKKPDYLGRSKWEFKYGNKTISASIEDADWLLKFQNRSYNVRPGDALKCLVTIEGRYGHDNELLSESYVIHKVNDVIENELEKQVDIIET